MNFKKHCSAKKVLGKDQEYAKFSYSSKFILSPSKYTPSEIHNEFTYANEYVIPASKHFLNAYSSIELSICHKFSFMSSTEWNWIFPFILQC